MYFIYILQSRKDSNLYIGFTTDLEKRIIQHNNGESLSTKARRPLRLVYYEAYASLADARKRERNLKLFSKAYNGLKQRIEHSLSDSTIGVGDLPA